MLRWVLASNTFPDGGAVWEQCVPLVSHVHDECARAGSATLKHCARADTPMHRQGMCHCKRQAVHVRCAARAHACKNAMRKMWNGGRHCERIRARAKREAVRTRARHGYIIARSAILPRCVDAPLVGSASHRIVYMASYIQDTPSA